LIFAADFGRPTDGCRRRRQPGNPASSFACFQMVGLEGFRSMELTMEIAIIFHSAIKEATTGNVYPNRY